MIARQSQCNSKRFCQKVNIRFFLPVPRGLMSSYERGRSRGMPRESLVAHQSISTGAHVYPHWSNLLLRLNDWVSENSSLFDGSSTRSTASTKDSTSEELWEHMSAEPDSVSSNSSLIISENSDGLACSPLGSRHWHVKADVPTPMIGPGSNASSSGREIDGTVAKRNSFLYSDNART